MASAVNASICASISRSWASCLSEPLSSGNKQSTFCGGTKYSAHLARSCHDRMTTYTSESWMNRPDHERESKFLHPHLQGMHSSLAGHHSHFVKLILVGWEYRLTRTCIRPNSAMLSIRLDSSVARVSPASSRATSGAVSSYITALTYTSSDASSTNGTTNGFYNDQSNRRRKQRVMVNCFPPPPPPDVVLSRRNMRSTPWTRSSTAG